MADIQITVKLACQNCGNVYNRTISLPDSGVV